MADYMYDNQYQTETKPSPSILSVSELTTKIKALLEKNIPFVWICGEISNLNSSVTGHMYFVLKDPNAQINAVMFKTQRRGLMFTPENGMKINCLGRINVYEERGTYQVIVEYAEKVGTGTLHYEFEQLKVKLEQEGLFAPERKRPLPAYPHKIVLITSPTGAVVHDMLRVAQTKMPLLIEVLPVRVQGAEAVGEIVNALNFLHELPDVEVAILARGGGSVEDMQPFNTEALARAIAKAPIPVISAVGHETDFTISDFVADLRAPTPSAAIDMLLPDRDEVLHKLDNLKRRLQGNLQSRVLLAQARLNRLQLGLPKTMLLEQQQCISYLEYKLKHSIIRKMQAKVQTLSLLKLQLALQDPQIKLNERRYSLEKAEQKLKSLLQAKLKASQDRTLILQQKLLLLGPTATLERGYAMVRDPEINEVLSDSGRFMVGQRLEIIVKNGHVWCAVEKVVKNG